VLGSNKLVERVRGRDADGVEGSWATPWGEKRLDLTLVLL
jgi:hypothetical protein